jgi:hypothetical protein
LIGSGNKLGDDARSDLSAGTARFMPHTCRLQYLSGSAQLLGNRAVVLRSILLPA